MFEEENLLKFEPFLFKNGAVPKPKYFVVLRTWREIYVGFLSYFKRPCTR